jgi:hypothetical protein
MRCVLIPKRVIDEQHLKSTINHMLKIYHNTTFRDVRFIDNDITNLQRSNLIILRPLEPIGEMCR